MNSELVRAAETQQKVHVCVYDDNFNLGNSPLTVVPADLRRHGTCSGHQMRSPLSEAVVGLVSALNANPPGVSRPAGFALQPLLFCSPAPSPGPPSCPAEDQLNREDLLSTWSNWLNYLLSMKCREIIQLVSKRRDILYYYCFVHGNYSFYLTLLFWALVTRGCLTSSSSPPSSNFKVSTPFNSASTLRDRVGRMLYWNMLQ